ncbi:50S ribosomal protein L37ae [Candidatus Micrarchaeota archaeon]|jgi:large subunit ribosomal protein L37Ae|nr:50S ribosomal protein L37ae [Candidatus Micrarchaeota archaeon]
MVSKQVRGGTKIRKRAKSIDKLKNSVYECPECRKVSLKRVSNAIWKCNSCGAEIAGGAYTPSTTPGKDIKRKLEGKS